MRILDAAAMRGVDRRAVEELGLPSLVLMENAAIGVADAIGESFPDTESVHIVCGPGNNGGDGLAIARHLVARGYHVDVSLLGGERGLQGDAETQLSICHAMDLDPVVIASEAELREALAAPCDLVVDALFGTGLSRPLEGLFATAAEWLSSVAVAVVAVDIPSGLDASRAHPIGPHAEADLTVTFAAPKIAHILPPACQAVGELVIADLGIPPDFVEEAPGVLRLLETTVVADLLEPRPIAGHKGTFGHLLVVAGGPGKSGAAVLAGRGALRSGAGLVTVAVPAPLATAVDMASLESMTLALPVGHEGGLSVAAVELVLAAAEERSAIAIGPGVGTWAGTPETVREIVARCPKPMVIDADGLNAFAGQAGRLTERPGPTVLTPHPGELGRLLGVPTIEIVEDRIGGVERACEQTGCVVVLKGYRTLVAVPEGEIGVNPTGSSALATGGTGDVLTGLVGGLLAQGYPPESAAALGVHLHGLAGDLASAESEEATVAGDLVRHLGGAFRRLRDA